MEQNTPSHEVDLTSVFKSIGNSFGNLIALGERNILYIVLFTILGILIHILFVVYNSLNPTFKSQSIVEVYAFDYDESRIYFDILNAAFKDNNPNTFSAAGLNISNGEQLSVNNVPLQQIKGLVATPVPEINEEERRKREEIKKEEYIFTNKPFPKYRLEILVTESDISNQTASLINDYFDSQIFKEVKKEKTNALKSKKAELQKNLDMLNKFGKSGSHVFESQQTGTFIIGEPFDVVGLSRQSRNIYEELLSIEDRLNQLGKHGCFKLLSPFSVSTKPEHTREIFSSNTVTFGILGFLLGYIFAGYREWKNRRNKA